jgi:single-strand DNA-binding protein
MSEKPLNRWLSNWLAFLLSVQRAALKAPPPFGRTLSFPDSATRLYEVWTPVPKASVGPLPQNLSSRRGSGPRRHILRTSMYRREADKRKNRSLTPCSTKSPSSAASVRTQKPKPVKTIASSLSSTSPLRKAGKNDKGDYETRSEWHRVYAWSNLSKFAKTLQKGQLITLEGILRHREIEDDVQGTRFKHRIAEIHASSLKRLSKIEAPDDPTDQAGDE